MRLLNLLSLFAIPTIMTMILIHGFIKKVNIYECFIEGAAEGFKTALRIMPYLVAIFLAIGVLRKSGGMDFIVGLFEPMLTPLGIPAEVLPLAFIRPVSGSGALAVLRDILQHYGADTFIGRVASIMMGSAETIFFTMAVYFGAVGIKRSGHTAVAALISHVAAVMASVYICKWFF